MPIAAYYMHHEYSKIKKNLGHNCFTENRDDSRGSFCVRAQPMKDDVTMYAASHWMCAYTK